MRYYLSGPMTGLEHHGFPAFMAATKELREYGVDVVSPAEMSIERAKRVMAASGLGEFAEYEDAPDLYEEVFARIPREEFLAADAIAVVEADGLIVLPGWEASDGACWEVALARKLNKQVLAYPSLNQLDFDPKPRGVRIVNSQTTEEALGIGHVIADPSGAVKADGGKARMDLLPQPALEGTAEVLAFGASKYADHNWRKGFAWSRIYGAALRHLTAWAEGEDLDPESGLSHLDHAACCVMFLQTYVRTGTGTDDRYKPEEK